MSDPILLVTGNFPPEIGGPATFIEALARYLTTKGSLVTVLCSSNDAADDSGRPYRVVRIPMRNLYAFEINVRLRMLAEIFSHRRILVNSLDPYVKQITGFISRPYIAKIVGDSAWERGRNLGQTTSGIDQFQSETEIPSSLAKIRAQRKTYLLRAGKIVTPSRYLARMVEGWGVPTEKISVIPNGCPDVAGDWPRAKRPPGDVIEALFVGRFTNWKGIETILIAMTEATNIHLTLCGDGPLLPTVVSLVDQLRLKSRVTFKGKVTREEIVATMGRSHVLVLPSLYEGLSHTLLDGLRSGLPAIATALGGNGEVITNGVEGLLVPPSDVEALRSAFRGVAERWQELSDAAFLRCADFTFDRCAEQYHKLLCE